MPEHDETGPLYDRIKRNIRAQIALGDHDPDRPFVTQREICDRYGVSTTTAIRALNELVAEGVLIRRRGKGTYVAEPTAPTPASAQSGQSARGAGDRTIACVVHGLHGPHVSQVVRGLESVGSDLGYRMFLSDSDNSAEREARALRQALDSGATGVVLYSVEGERNGELLEEFRRRGIPLVLVDRYRTDLATDAVLADNFAVGYELTKRLVERGHQRIATLWGETRCTSVRDRLTGHTQALRDAGLPVRAELTVLRSYWPLPDPARRAMLARLLEVTEPPTVFLCAHGYVVAAAAKDLLQQGVAVPEQVDLAGMDDAGPYDLLPLTAVAAVLPSYDLGVAAMRLLAERIGTGNAYADPQHIVLPVEIRDRDTAAVQLRAVVPGGAGS